MIEDMPASETLAEEELVAITGYKWPKRQLAWLDENGWKYHRNRAGRPIVGRAYARMKMAGVSTSRAPAKEQWTLDLSRVH